MFKKFFEFIVTVVKTYVKKNGVIKSICNAIRGITAAVGVAVVGSTAYKQLKAKFMIKWELRKNKNKYSDTSIYKMSAEDPNSYDANGYRLTNTEYYNQNMNNLKMAEELYTDDNIQCVKIIEANDPKVFNGMDMDHKLMYIDENGITFEDLIYKYGLDKDSQVRKYLAEETGVPIENITNEQLQEFWNEAEASKIGIGSKVNKGYKKPKSKKKQAKEKLIKFFNPEDYAEMEKYFGVANFYTMNPEKIAPELVIRRQRFDQSVAYASGFLNWMYVHNKAEFKRNLHVCNDDPIILWETLVKKYMTDDEVFEEAKKDFNGRLELLASEAKGHKFSTRPRITSLEEADYIDKIENLLDKMNDIEMKRKCNIPPDAVVEDDDEEEDIFEEEEDMDFGDDDPIPEFTDDSILDQLDALRAGAETTEVVPEVAEESKVDIINPKPMIKKPVKMIQNPEEVLEETDPSRVIYMNPKEYTIKARANKMLNLYSKYHKDSKELADAAILTMLDDEHHENFKVYEVSNEMKAYRQSDREHQLAFKLVPSDYTTKEERNYAVNQFEEAVKIYGLDNWKAMIDQRMEYYYTLFEVECADDMMKQLHAHPMDREEKVDLVRMFIQNGYGDCVARVDSVEEYYKEALTRPKDVIQELVIEDNMDEYAATELPED